jgi:hypothetical protein
MAQTFSRSGLLCPLCLFCVHCLGVHTVYTAGQQCVCVLLHHQRRHCEIIDTKSPLFVVLLNRTDCIISGFNMATGAFTCRLSRIRFTEELMVCFLMSERWVFGSDPTPVASLRNKKHSVPCFVSECRKNNPMKRVDLSPDPEPMPIPMLFRTQHLHSVWGTEVVTKKPLFVSAQPQELLHVDYRACALGRGSWFASSCLKGGFSGPIVR